MRGGGEMMFLEQMMRKIFQIFSIKIKTKHIPHIKHKTIVRRQKTAAEEAEAGHNLCLISLNVNKSRAQYDIVTDLAHIQARAVMCQESHN